MGLKFKRPPGAIFPYSNPLSKVLPWANNDKPSKNSSVLFLNGTEVGLIDFKLVKNVRVVPIWNKLAFITAEVSFGASVIPVIEASMVEL